METLTQPTATVAVRHALLLASMKRVTACIGKRFENPKFADGSQYACVLLCAQNNELTLTADAGGQNAGFVLRETLPYEGADLPRLEVNAFALFALLKGAKVAKNAPAYLEWQDATNNLTVTIDGNATKLPAEDRLYRMLAAAHMLPKMPVERIALDMAALLPTMRELLPFVSTDELRPGMSGLHFNISKKQIEVVATNGTQLGCYTHLCAKGMPDLNFTLSKNAIKFLCDQINPAKLPCELGYDAENLNAVFRVYSASDLHFTVYCKASHHEFCDYKGATPGALDSTYTVNRKEMLKGLTALYPEGLSKNGYLQTALIGAAKGTNTLRLTQKQYAEHTPAEDGPVYEMPFVDGKGAPFLTFLNAKFLHNILSAIDAEQVTFGMAKGWRAVMITPCTNSTTNAKERTCWLIAPIETQNTYV
jgi:DNA polymerase III sliding clamp (beta) subunit (PCNA family)